MMGKFSSFLLSLSAYVLPKYNILNDLYNASIPPPQPTRSAHWKSFTLESLPHLTWLPLQTADCRMHCTSCVSLLSRAGERARLKTERSELWNAWSGEATQWPLHREALLWTIIHLQRSATHAKSWTHSKLIDWFIYSLELIILYNEKYFGIFKIEECIQSLLNHRWSPLMTCVWHLPTLECTACHSDTPLPPIHIQIAIYTFIESCRHSHDWSIDKSEAHMPTERVQRFASHVAHFSLFFSPYPYLRT